MAEASLGCQGAEPVSTRIVLARCLAKDRQWQKAEIALEGLPKDLAAGGPVAELRERLTQKDITPEWGLRRAS